MSYFRSNATLTLNPILLITYIVLHSFNYVQIREKGVQKGQKEIALYSGNKFIKIKNTAKIKYNKVWNRKKHKRSAAVRTKKLHVPSEKEKEKVNEGKWYKKKNRGTGEGGLSNRIYLRTINIYHFFSESFYKFFFFFLKGHTSVEVDFSIRVCARVMTSKDESKWLSLAE